MRSLQSFVAMMILVAVLLCPLIGHGEEHVDTFFDGDFEYTINKDGTATIIRWTGEEKYLCVPSELAGKQVSSIKADAFFFGENLSRVELSDGIIELEGDAFDGCTNLREIILPNSLRNIDSNPFTNCTSLETIKVSQDHSTLATIDNVLFDKLDKRLITYPAGNYGINEYAIPHGITKIGDFAFSSCAALQEVMISDSVTEIGDYAFFGCEELQKVVIPDNVRDIGHHCFQGCTVLTYIKLPEGISRIEDGMFYCCTSLETFEIPSSVKEIGRSAFERTKLSAELIIPDGVTAIGDYAFGGCSYLTKVSIGKNVTTIGVNPFASCTRLCTIEVAADNATFASIEGILYNKQETMLISYPCGRPDDGFRIPDGILSIGETAFVNCSMRYVTLPQSLKSIQKWAFGSCNNLCEITIPKGITEITEGVFSGCTSLDKVTFEGSITSIGLQAFMSCFQLTYIELPEGVIDIGHFAFAETSISELVLPQSVQKFGFYSFPNGCILTVRRGSKAHDCAVEYGYEFIYEDANDRLYE